MCRWCLACERHPVTTQMHRSGSGPGETSCVHSCGGSLQTSCEEENQFICVSINATWNPVRESRRGGSLSEMQNTISPRTRGLSAGGGDVIRITQLWQRKRSEHTSSAAKNWCCWFERMLPDGQTDRVCSECVQSRQCLCHKSQVRRWSWNRASKLSGWRQVVQIQFKLRTLIFPCLPMNPFFISLHSKWMHLFALVFWPVDRLLCSETGIKTSQLKE